MYEKLLKRTRVFYEEYGLLIGGLQFCPAAQALVKSKPKKIVTSFTILADITKNIAGTAAIVESITKPGAEIHEYEPTPQDVVKAQRADLVIYNGMNLELWFDKFYGGQGCAPHGGHGRHQAARDQQGPYTGKPNPHSWMSPANVMIYTENIRKALVKLDPQNAAIYDKNAAAYVESLKEVDQFLKSKLVEVPEKQRWLVSSEGAFSYLTSDYGMKEAYIWPINADAEDLHNRSRSWWM